MEKEEEAKALIAGLILHVVTTEPLDRRTLATVREYLTLAPARFADLLAAMQDSAGAGGLVARAANRQLGKSDREAAGVLGLSATLPPWQIVKEKRATFAQIPSQVALRPGPRTRWGNLFLAGDWINTGLPASIEGTLRSGFGAADLAMAP